MSGNNLAAVTVTDVSKSFRIYSDRSRSLKGTVLHRGRNRYEDFQALKNISLEIPEGKTFGLLGHNGSGKSTLLKCIARILTPNSGTIVSRGRIAAMLEVGSGFHPELSGRENIFLNGSILGMSRKEIAAKFDEIVDFSEIGDFIDQPVKNYSSGMYVRLGFSVSIHVEPEILLVDEILAVGDLDFQDKCRAKFAEFKQSGRTVVIVSHGLEEMKSFCDEVAWLDHGKIREIGDPLQIINKYSDLSHQVHAVEGGGSRFGSGEAQISSIELLDSDNRETHLVQTGDSVTIRLHYTAHKTIEEPVFGTSIETRDGLFIWGFHGRDDNFVPQTISPGQGYLDVSIPRLMLRPNSYVLSASIQDRHASGPIDILRKATYFDVGVGPYMESGGIIALNAHFSQISPRTPIVGRESTR